MRTSNLALLLANLSTAYASRRGGLSRRQAGPIDPSTTPNCTYYTDWPQEYLDQGDTCASIASFWSISERAFIIWNPIVGSDCSNLIEGNSYCIEENGSTSDPPLSTTSRPASSSSSTSASSRSTASTATSSSESRVSTSSSRISSTPTSTLVSTSSIAASSSTGGSQAPSPTQGGLTADCQRYYLVQSGDFCQAIVDQYGTFSLSEFYSWNPAVGNNCGGLQAGYYVCVGVGGTPIARPTTTTGAQTTTSATFDPSRPTPTQGGLTSDCQRYYLVESGDFCQGIVDRYGTFTLSQFYSWNPAVGNNCGGLQAGYYVCVGVSGTPSTRPASTSTSTTAAPSPTGPQPQQPNVVRDCQRFHRVQSGDSCQVIVDRYRTFTLNQFLTWNPDVGSNCGGLWLDYYVCIGVAGTPTTPPPTSTSPRPTGSPAPSPTQSGIPSSCSRYGQAQSGGTCSAFAQQYGISLGSLYAWNPVLGRNGENCQNSFWAGYYYCVRA